MTETQDDTLNTREHYEREAAQISFLELQKHFAKGILIEVSSDLNLIDVAMAMHRDDVSVIEQWMNNQQLVRAHDEHASKWHAEQTRLMAVTVAPWVLVQEPNRS
ncbi:DUF2288 family protein [Marinicella sediminis]|uniref:DUF2288 family protein n=1 Tax=Marinicella sediminis TaxID=1792834 RepID=A0ABV7JF24_9GAMM|nr:DUF2288 family protein [Marinicella sediminis]